MDLFYKVVDKKYSNLKEVIKAEFNISSRLYIKLRNAKKIYLNREN